MCEEFLAFKYVFCCCNKSDDYLYLYIINLENSRLKPDFRYTISIYICVSRYRILNGYCVVEKQVLNVSILDF